MITIYCPPIIFAHSFYEFVYVFFTLLGKTFFNPRVQYRSQLSYVGRLKACVLDWGGTVIDCGVFAPAVGFVEVFKQEGVPITMDEARGPMGIHKRVIWLISLYVCVSTILTVGRLMHCYL